ncbi:hypothetical protein AHAS_Ahas01G0234200 [Arachis hypogaea]
MCIHPSQLLLSKYVITVLSLQLSKKLKKAVGEYGNFRPFLYFSTLILSTSGNSGKIKNQHFEQRAHETHEAAL